MRFQGKVAGPAVTLAGVAALLLAPVARAGEGAPAPAKGGKDNAPAPAARGPSDKAPAPKTTDKAPPAKAAESKPGAPTANQQPPAAKPGKSLWATMDDFMERTGNRVQEMRFLGMRVRPTFSETISFTDNAFYQDSGDSIVVDRTPRPGATPNTTGPGADPDANGDSDPRAHPHLGGQRGRVAEFVNVARLGVGLGMPVNTSLLPALFRGQNPQSEINAASAYFEDKHYLLHSDSPNAWNWGASVDVPVLLDNVIGRLARISGEKSHIYFRLEGDFNHVTDPLDVQTFGIAVDSTVVDDRGNFYRVGDRNDFERQEWWVKGTLGWDGPVLDGLVSVKHYNFDLRDDKTLDTADHTEDTGYGELGFKVGQHRVFGFFEHTVYEFGDRHGPNGDIQSLRDFARSRTGLGISGPILSQKVTGKVQVFYMNSNIFNQGKYSEQPFYSDPESGVGVAGPGGNAYRVPFQEQNWIAGDAEVAYSPFKPTRVTVDYSRRLDWSVVAQSKMVDTGSISFSHNINPRLTAMLQYKVSRENVAFREERLYQEFGAGIRYSLMAHTDLDLQYTLRYMRSSDEPRTNYVDFDQELFQIRPNGDFLANIVSLGITVTF